MREPRSLAAAEQRLGAVESEIVQEKAAALGRSFRRAESALRRLRELDAAAASAMRQDGGPASLRADAVTAAAERVWYLLVQRESCGLRDAEAVLAALDVPREVRLRMGTRPARPQEPGGALTAAPQRRCAEPPRPDRRRSGSTGTPEA